MTLGAVTDMLVERLRPLQFTSPVSVVYNPLIYARKPWDIYCRRYGDAPKDVLLVGMNPGPWGMAQTGIPFGDVGCVTNWLKIEAPVEKPATEHPGRPVDGFSCKRREVSGQRVWQWARDRWGTPERFFSRVFIGNYCPLIFLEESGKNRTPNTLRAAERKPLTAICDLALRETVQYLRPKWVIGVGAFAAQRAETALKGLDVPVRRITHPSPANPKANKGWAEIVTRELADAGVFPACG